MHWATMYMTMYFCCTVNPRAFFLPLHLLMDHFPQIPQHCILLILFSIGLHCGHFYTCLTSNMMDVKLRTERAREKYCARSIAHHKTHLLGCNPSQNPVVFSSEFILKTKGKICSDNVKIILLPNYFSFQILFTLFYIIMAHMKTQR